MQHINMDCCMNENESKRIYRQPLNYENGIILPLIRDCCVTRSGNPKAFQVNVQSLSLVLPKDLRDKAFEFWNRETIRHDLTDVGREKFDEYFMYILKLLEDHNICFPKISFDVGHD